MHPAPGEANACWEWEEGLWRNVTELGAVLQVARRFEDRAGSAEAARRAIGGVTIRRVLDGTAEHHAGQSLITVGNDTFDQPWVLSALLRQWGPKVAIAHELAHYWDWKTGDEWSRMVGAPGIIVEGMSGVIQGEPGPTWWAREAGVVEDWAESVAGYLFPEYFRALRAEASVNPLYQREYYQVKIYGPVEVTIGPGLLPHHLAYVEAQFRALSVFTP